MRIVFMWSPEFALPSLRRLIESEHDVVAVYTQPDRPAGRGRKPAPPPVKALALDHGIPVLQPRSISKPDAVAAMRELAPDVGVIAAYGQILRQPVLDVPPRGILNVHASLLPRWRGAAPIPAAILAGDAEAGATIMRVVLALDAGPMLDSVRVPIEAEDTTATVTPRIAEAGAELLMRVLLRWRDGVIEAVAQDDALATYAPQIEKKDALIDWARDDAATIARQVRAYNPWPVAYTHLEGAPLRIFAAAETDEPVDAPPGTIVSADGLAAGAGFGVATRRGVLAIMSLQPSGRPIMRASEFVRGRRGLIGSVLG